MSLKLHAYFCTNYRFLKDCIHLNHSTAGGDSRKDPKVVFIVSTVNLVLQQKDRFEDFLGDKYSVGEISGANSTEIPLKYLLQKHEVVVMTAQILVNALNSKNMEERVELSDISLLLFDECHHADKEHSYNRIMERYLALKTQAGKQHSLPQVYLDIALQIGSVLYFVLFFYCTAWCPKTRANLTDKQTRRFDFV